MEFNKDILNFLNIETSYIVTEDKLCMCMPLRFSGLTFFVSSDSGDLTGKVKFKVKFHGSFIYLDSIIIKRTNETMYSFVYELGIMDYEKDKDSFKKTFFLQLKKMEEQSESWNKRKEIRYDIGLDEKLGELLNFKSMEQVLIADKIQLPCIINNISYSGAKITTLEGKFSKDKLVCLNLSFKNPIEQIPLVASIKNCFIKSTNEKKIISVLSIKYDYSPISYKQRIDSYIQALNERGMSL